MGLTHLGAIVQLKVNPLFSGCDNLLICQCYSVDVAFVTINCTHVVCQMPAITLINQNCNCLAVSCLLRYLGLWEP